MPVQIPANLPVTAILARDRTSAAAAQVARPFVAVGPYYTTWDDFGRQYGVRLWAFLAGDQQFEFEMHLMFDGAANSLARINQLLGTNAWVSMDQVPEGFCSVLDKMAEYSELVRWLGFEYGVSVLRSVGDAIVTRVEGTNNARLALISSSDFHFGALRSNETFTAFRSASRHLTPHAIAAVGDSARSFDASVRLPSAANPYEIRFDYEHDPLSRDRISILIGRNGSGKTQFLLNFILGLRDWHSQVTRAAPMFEPTPQYSRVLMFSSVASDPYPREIYPWDGIDYQYFSMIASQVDERDALTSALIACLRDEGRIQFYPTQPLQSAGRLELLERAIRSLGIWESIYLKLREQTNELDHGREFQGSWYFPLSRARRLNEQRALLLVQRVDWEASPVMLAVEPSLQPRRLSSGELAMLRFAAQAAANVEHGCVMLFDEPETHLHPNFISDFMDVLHILVMATRSVAIIATHSAYVVREVPRQRVRVFSLTEGQVSIDTPRLQTFGASVDSISQFVFGDTDVSHRYQDTLRSWVYQLPRDTTIEMIVAQFGHQMNSETLSLVRNLLRNRTP